MGKVEEKKKKKKHLQRSPQLFFQIVNVICWSFIVSTFLEVKSSVKDVSQLGDVFNSPLPDPESFTK